MRDGLIGQAFEFAVHAHLGEFRKATADPFIIHPVRVAMRTWPYLDELGVAAALLHDTVEMHGSDLSDFPERVREMVDTLTCRNEGKPDAESKEDHIRRICEAFDDDAILIKFADRIDNLKDGSKAFGRGWLTRYLSHTQLLVDLTDRPDYGDHPLRRELIELVGKLL
jgi:(p)ppGpp synthase/HD superfamily hydrolase